MKIRTEKLKIQMKKKTKNLLWGAVLSVQSKVMLGERRGKNWEIKKNKGHVYEWSRTTEAAAGGQLFYQIASEEYCVEVG